MEGSTDSLENLYQKIEDYIKLTIELGKLKTIDTTISVMTAMISKLSVLVMFSLFLLVLSMGLAFWFGELLGKIYYGFFVVGLLYLSVAILFNARMHKWLKKPLSEFIINQSID